MSAGDSRRYTSASAETSPSRRPLWPAVTASVLVHALLIVAAFQVRISLPPSAVPAGTSWAEAIPLRGNLVATIEWPVGDNGAAPADRVDPLTRSAWGTDRRPAFAPLASPRAIEVVAVDDRVAEVARHLRNAVRDDLASTSLSDPADPTVTAGLAAGSPTGIAGGTGPAGAGGGAGSGQNGWGGTGGRGQPAYLGNPTPTYPRLARERGWEGVTLLSVEVLTNGTPRQVQVLSSSGYALLDATALDAVRRWRFAPAQRENQLVVSHLEIPIRFRLLGD